MTVHSIVMVLPARERLPFWFTGRPERDLWRDQVRGLMKDRASSHAETGPRERVGGPRLEPVVILKRRPNLSYQVLGPVDASDEKRWRAKDGLQIRGALLGADAVVDVQEERLPGFNRTVRRMSGIAIRAVSEDGRSELRSRRFTRQMGEIGLLLILTCLVSFLFAFETTTLGLRAGQVDPDFERAYFGARLLLPILSHAWLLGLAALLLLLKWPQLARTTAVGLLAYTALPAAVPVGALIGGLQGGKGSVMASMLLGFSSPITPVPFVAFYGFVIFLAGRIWRVHREYRRSMSRGDRRSPWIRRAVTGSVMAATVLFGLLLHATLANAARLLVLNSSDLPPVEQPTDPRMPSTKTKIDGIKWMVVQPLWAADDEVKAPPPKGGGFVVTDSSPVPSKARLEVLPPEAG